jgi:hypothetical protein
MELDPQHNYFSKLLTRRKPLLISGPCSAESESQVLETAIALKIPASTFSAPVSGNRDLNLAPSKGSVKLVCHG